MKANTWASLYAAKRRAIDKAILQDCEARIAAEEQQIPDTIDPMSAIDDAIRAEITRTFGRPPQ